MPLLLLSRPYTAAVPMASRTGHAAIQTRDFLPPETADTLLWLGHEAPSRHAPEGSAFGNRKATCRAPQAAHGLLEHPTWPHAAGDALSTAARRPTVDYATTQSLGPFG